MSEHLRKRLAQIATSIANIEGQGDEFPILVGALSGAAFSLAQAIELGWDSDGVDYQDVELAEFLKETRSVAACVAGRRLNDIAQIRGQREAREIVGPWIAGFFFTSGLMRISACADRIDVSPTRQYANQETTALALVRRHVNWFKHYSDIDDRKSKTRWSDALQAFEDLLTVGEQSGAFRFTNVGDRRPTSDAGST